ncbi:TlpA family protein disulfide reductase [Aurantiacibacter sp. D1-12]|uniref:TlpA family protein disulfide reductase n=1 Tax=Aurantiacibacter sp. D1-12 TaxID=2993658 RepID=UPI00237D30C0|nr:TlpA disulfide reductase family protein [Aurantiacibacter sp. D1-12]MDE1467835.1 TlpA disulfide reductase family protein [Aurantiacibacter sp. D1-12]
MAKISLSRFAAACLAAGLLAACDNGGDDAAQESTTVDAESRAAALTGTLDRSFVGETIPEVTVEDPSGETLTLNEIGEPVLINLWATWCAPCVVEMPLLDELAADLEGQVRVLTISEDLQGAEAVVPFFAERDLPNLPQWMDQQNTLAFSYGGGAVLPLTILYDAEGREVWRVIGAYDWETAEAREEVLEALVPVQESAE